MIRDMDKGLTHGHLERLLLECSRKTLRKAWAFTSHLKERDSK